MHAGNRIDAAARATPRFPATAVPAVSRRIEAVLRELQPSTVVTAAAAGADLLVLDAAHRLGVACRIVLPLPRDRFAARSVDDLGHEWTRRYGDALRTAAAVVEVDLSEHDDWYLRGNDAILDDAQRGAVAAGAPLLALVVRPAPSGPPSATDDFAVKATARGLRVLEVDPTG